MSKEAIESAERASREIKFLFDELGNEEHPDGEVVAAYRRARRELARTALDLALVLAVLASLRRDVQFVSNRILTEAALVGREQARREATIYDLPFVAQPAQTAAEMQSVIAAYEAQAAQITALAALGDRSLILGDAGRVGALTPAPIIGQLMRWITTIAVAGYMAHILISVSGQESLYARQAVAVVDSRTTETCRNVHGQQVGLREPFRLTGTPQFAAEMLNPPFHYGCRTTVALVRRTA